MMSMTLRALLSCPSSASSAEGLAPMSTSTSPIVCHCKQGDKQRGSTGPHTDTDGVTKRPSHAATTGRGLLVPCCANEGQRNMNREACHALGDVWCTCFFASQCSMTACLALNLVEELLLLDVKAVTEHLIACASQHNMVSENCWCEGSLRPSLDISCTAGNLARLHAGGCSSLMLQLKPSEPTPASAPDRRSV